MRLLPGLLEVVLRFGFEIVSRVIECGNRDRDV